MGLVEAIVGLAVLFKGQVGILNNGSIFVSSGSSSIVFLPRYSFAVKKVSYLFIYLSDQFDEDSSVIGETAPSKSCLRFYPCLLISSD